MFRFGIIGAGAIADKFCSAVALMDGVQVAAVGSKAMSRAQASALRNHIPAAYDDYRRMLESEKLDAVYIATTHNFHYENLMLCIEFGLPALCEKCMVLTERQARDVFDAADRKKVFVMEAMWTRFLPAFKKAAALVREGAIGAVVSAHYRLGFHFPSTSSRLNPALAGGAMYDLGVYAIEGLMGLIGRPVTDLRCKVRWSKDGLDLTDHVILEFEDSLASFDITVCSTTGTHCEIYGTEGKLILPEAAWPSECTVLREDGGEIRHVFPFENGFQYEIAHFIECLREGRAESGVVPHALTVECARIFELCLKR